MANSFYHVLPSGAGGKDGSDWANAMSITEFEASVEGGGGQAVAVGDTYFFKGTGAEARTFTVASIIASLFDGTAIEPVSIIGLKHGTTNEGASVVYTDWARDVADMPIIACGTNDFQFDNYWIIRNLDVRCDDTYGLRADLSSIIENCKAYNANDGTGRYAIYTNGGIINCEAYCLGKTKNHAIYLAINGAALYSYIHDANTGATTNDAAVILHCIFADCTVGIDSTDEPYPRFINNTFYECDSTIIGTTSWGLIAMNNIVEGSDTAGMSWTTQTDVNFFWKNHGDDARNTDMWDNVDATGIYSDHEVTTGDPKFTTAGSDFSLESDSPCLDTGQTIESGVG